MIFLLELLAGTSSRHFEAIRASEGQILSLIPLEGLLKVNPQSSSALVAQWIEHRPPEAGAQVRLLSGAPHNYFKLASLRMLGTHLEIEIHSNLRK